MITIDDKFYTLPELKKASTIYIVSNCKTDWQRNFWQFIKDWFDEEQDFISVQTSGSTGKPKTIQHAKKYMLASANMTNSFFGLNESKMALLCLPAKAIGGMMMIVRALSSGMHLVIQKPSSTPLKALDKNYDFVAMVPFQVQSIFDTDAKLWQKIKTLIIGGGEVSSSLRNEIKLINLRAFSTFGMTETISHIALNEISNSSRNSFKALEGVKLSKGKDDNLIINAAHLGVLDLETNDVVRFEAENEFLWLGRIDNAIESGGIKFQPEQIEQKLRPFIAGNFIISYLQDKKLNNKLVLVLEGKNISKTLINEALEVLPQYEKPREIIFVEALQFVPNGKIDRKKTKALIEAIFNK